MFLAKSVKESFVFNVIMSFFEWISRLVQNSGVYSWLGSDLFTEKYYETSCIYRLLDFIQKKLMGIIRRIQVFVRRIFKNSLSLYLFDRLFSREKVSIDVVMALFLGVMFVLPHERWNNLYFVMAAAAFAFWTVMRIAADKIRIKGVKGAGVSILTFLVAIVISTMTALVISDAVRFALFLLASVICTYCIYLTVDTKEKLVRFIRILLIFVTLTGVFGIIQRIRGVDVNPEFVDMFTNNGMPGRVYSTFSNPNNFAQLLVLFMPFFVPAIFSSKKIKDKIVLFAALCITFVALAMTYSRSCWVGIALAVAVFVCIFDKRFIIPLAFVVVAAIPFLPDTIMNRIFTIGSMEDSSNSYRIYIWESCWEMIKDFGTTGLGLGPASFRVMYPGYASVVAVTAPHSHMLYMQIILEMGILGAVAFFSYMFAVTKKAAGSMRKMSTELRCYTAAAISALAGIAFVCCAEYIWFYPRIMFAFWIIPGIMMAAIKITKGSYR